MSRNYFGTDGIRGRAGELPMTFEHVEHVGFAFGCALRESCDTPTLLIGRDTRATGPLFEDALSRGLTRAGVCVVLLGVLPTPAVAYLTKLYGADAGAVISASHNPAHDNGVKFFNREGRKISDAFQARVLELMEHPPEDSKVLGATGDCFTGEADYVAFCVASEPQLQLNGVRLVVDAAHGAAYRTAKQTFEALGAQVVMVGDLPDGNNINDGVGATHVQALQAAVLQHQADFGVALDGDADRLIMVDALGQAMDGDVLLYVLAKDRATQRPVRGVAGTIMSNMGLQQSLQALGIEMVRTKVGDRYLAQALDEQGWELGAESSGHILDFSKLPTGDGTLAAIGVMAAFARAGNSAPRMVEGLTIYPQVLESVPVRNRSAAWQDNARYLQACAHAEQRLAGQGHLLVRASGTEPVIRVMVEAKEPQLAREVADFVHAELTALCAA